MSLSAPTYTPATIVGQALAEALSPWLTVDLAAYADAIGAMFQPVDALIQQTDVDGTPDYIPPYGVLFNPATCPSYALPYLAQFVGVTVTPGASDAQARSQIMSEQGMNRGTPAAIIAAAKIWLSGDQNVILLERQRSDGSTSAYSFVVVIETSELATGPTWLSAPGTWAASTATWSTGDYADGLIGSVNATKPAGTVWELVSTAGHIWSTATKTWSAETATWSQADTVTV